MKQCDRKTLELLVLGCWAHEEISIGRARELLGWPDNKIREQAERRVSSAVKLREERDRLESDRGTLAMMLRRALRRMKQYEMDVDTERPRDHRQFMEQAEVLLRKMGFLTPLRENETGES